MFGYFSIFNYFFPKKDNQQILQEAYDILNNDTIEVVEEIVEELEPEVDPYACTTKSGTITQANGTSFIIDDKYKFESDLENLNVGTKVSFIAHLENREYKVSNLVVLDGDWGYVDPSEGKAKWCSRIVVTQVIKRDGRVLHFNTNKTTLNLNEVNSEFIPIVGDWVQLDVKCTLDEHSADLSGTIIAIDKISPIRPMVINEKITHLFGNEGCGIIGNKYWFNFDALPPSHFPAIGKFFF